MGQSMGGRTSKQYSGRLAKLKAGACSFASRADSQANAHVEFAPLLLDYATTCKAELDANSLTPAVANELADELHSRWPTA